MDIDNEFEKARRNLWRWRMLDAISWGLRVVVAGLLASVVVAADRYPALWPMVVCIALFAGLHTLYSKIEKSLYG